MKTIIDAVNDLEGNMDNSFSYSKLNDCYLFYSPTTPTSYIGDYTDDTEGGAYQLVCTIEEFNQCVEEMSEGLFVPLYKEDKAEGDIEVIDNIELETVEYEGNTYQIGAYYEFSGDEDFSDRHLQKLLGLDEDETSFPFETCSEEFKYCREVQSNIPVGTITKAPIKLKDGTLVMFDCGSDLGTVGKVYTSAITGVKMIGFVNDNRFREANKCENIVKLVPEV